MNRQQAKDLLPIIQAYVNDKTIQYYKVDLNFKIEHPGEPNFNDKWVDVDEDHLFRPDFYNYRIKPEPKYRPFANAEECWREMQKHQPFGWVKTDEGYEQIWHANKGDDFNATFKTCTFADGTPFGIKEE